jgi:N-acetylmuramoyl-L-alanine amidase
VHRRLRWGALVSLQVGALLFILGIGAPRAWGRVRHNDSWARQQFSKAERMREALNGRPVGERTRHEYQRVIDAYRRVYFGSPASSKADPSVVATAELMVEMGRRFDDNKILRGAIEQYRFLRKEYPGSKYRFDALFTIGEIYKDDLNDTAEARKTFEDFLHRYPRNRLAEDARAAVKELDDEQAEVAHAARKGPRGSEAKEGRKQAGATAAGGDGNSSLSASGTSDGEPNPASNGFAKEAGAVGEGRNELPRVTGVRHWSTPNYTRVAIDVEQDVKFNSQRIANPDRIFFDLKDTKLASTLVGKTFDVEDGFLKRIRVAEFKPGQTRIVLEVDDLSRYDAFLLPDPYRLIIDIHGKQSRAVNLAKGSGAESGTAGPPSAWSGTEASASSGAADNSSDLTDRKGPVKSEKEHAIVAKAANGDSSADSDDEDDSGERRSLSLKEELAREKASDREANDSSDHPGVVKTTVAVKGTNRRIPKTIVEADDDEGAAQDCQDAISAPRAANGKGSSTPALKRCATQNQSESGAANRNASASANQSAFGEGRNSVTDTEHISARNGPAGSAGRDNTRDADDTSGGSADGTVEDTKLSHPGDLNALGSRRNSLGNMTQGRMSAGQRLAGAEDTTNRASTTSLNSTKSAASARKKSRTSSTGAADTEDLIAREARPTAAGDRSLTRALGLKIGKIVIDAGHGGHDTGTIGPHGLLEKDLVLDVSKRLGRLLEARLGAEVIYTRQDDTFIPLETRTAIANREQADLFISIHANSSHDEDARGVETYYLNFTSSPDALEVAARENAVSEKSIHELGDLVKKIALKDKIDESREFAADVQDSLYSGLALNNAGIRNRGVKKAPFIVLIGANMPSILAEVSFVSNPTDERRLETSEQRQRIAESLYRGVSKYVGGLSGVKVASKIERPEGQ